MVKKGAIQTLIVNFRGWNSRGSTYKHYVLVERTKDHVKHVNTTKGKRL